MELNDRIIGLLTVLAGVLIFTGTLGLREVPGQALGSAFFPRIIAGVFVLTGAALIATAAPAPYLRLPKWMRGGGGVAAAGVVAAVICWIAAVEALGFLLATWILISSLAVLLGGRIWIALIVAAGATALFHMIFVELLRVPLPRGVIEALLS
ncbi:tripartite tricarboxylate transporter TctB family protein [Pikeienuella sp. HZG-20]|uniref:tripartite tricarboxylate transporter TctB family protein n=1 Tax=Paludibacillus litoralis TaxID=3133267 RepID=UPI0030ED32AC